MHLKFFLKLKTLDKIDLRLQLKALKQIHNQCMGFSPFLKTVILIEILEKL